MLILFYHRGALENRAERSVFQLGPMQSYFHYGILKISPILPIMKGWSKYGSFLCVAPINP